MASLPIRFSELTQLTSLGIDPAAISFNSCVSTCPPLGPCLEPARLAAPPSSVQLH
ncbi:hypothetical protein IMZ48_02825 [Candidatus Bathyarchaeota archaeon]|nr:hypothetical protein [Candidatus Bathyarchaeota archaeon]